MKNTKNVNVILVIDSGLPEDPHVFYTEQAAGIEFEKQVSAKQIGFRTKQVNETWQEYYDSYVTYFNSEECKFDPMDWEIHWYGITIEDDPIPDEDCRIIKHTD